MPIWGYRRALLVWLSAPLLLAGCATSRPAARAGSAGSERAEDAEAEKERTSADGARVERALERALKEPAVLASLRIGVECQEGSRPRGMRVFGSGVGIWEECSQFRLTNRQLEAMVRALLDGGFSALKETYGEEEKDSVTIEVCQLDVAVAGVAKQVVQLAYGEQSPGLTALADRLLALGAAAAEPRVTAADLREGLEKLARGELAPETWQVTLQRHPEIGRSAPQQGFLLRIAGTRATVRARPASGYGEPLEMDLAAPAVRALAGELAASGLEQWPVNLYAVDYVNLDLRVLNHGKSVQARQFSGMDPGARPQQQAQLDRVLTLLEAIARQVLAEGRPVAPDQ